MSLLEVIAAGISLVIMAAALAFIAPYISIALSVVGFSVPVIYLRTASTLLGIAGIAFILGVIFYYAARVIQGEED